MMIQKITVLGAGTMGHSITLFNLFPEISNATETSRLLKKKVAEGKFGVKSGEGFYKYPDPIETRLKYQKKASHAVKTA